MFFICFPYIVHSLQLKYDDVFKILWRQVSESIFLKVHFSYLILILFMLLDSQDRVKESSR